MVREDIVESIKKASGSDQVQLTTPENEEFGDFSTNIALIRAQKEGKKAKDLAEKIVESLKKDKKLLKIANKVEVAGPGFINFYLASDYLKDELKEVIKKGQKYGHNDSFKAKHIMVEYAHPNTHKQFHIGHLRNITLGESISRLLEVNGAKLTRVNYQGDVGLHIAKTLWGLEKLNQKKFGSLDTKMSLLGDAYAKGNKEYEKSKIAKKEITQINVNLYNSSDTNLITIYNSTKKWSLEYFEDIYKRVGTKFDRLYFESEVAEEGLKIAKSALGKGVLSKSKGAVIYEGEEKGLHNRVFITSEGLATYEAKDLGLYKLQNKEYKPDLIIHVVGPEQTGYFEVVFKVLTELFPDSKGRELHVSYGWVRLKKGKMASREGKVVLGNWLIDEAKKKIVKKYKTKEEVAEQIAVGAVKYSFLKHSLMQEIAFDFDESISLEGNSGPYLQYTYARTQSVLKKSRSPVARSNRSADKRKYRTTDKLNKEEELLMRSIAQYYGVTIDAGKNYSPNTLCNYLFELAQKYNHLYNSHKIIGSDEEDFRIALTKATGIILKNGLDLLGIQAPEKM